MLLRCSRGVARSALLMALLVGCAMKQKKVLQELQHPAPINCATADGDLRVLESEKANVAERIGEGVTAIYPASAVIGLVAGIEGTKLRVAAGEYNSAIDGRIMQIKQTCGIQ